MGRPLVLALLLSTGCVGFGVGRVDVADIDGKTRSVAIRQDVDCPKHVQDQGRGCERVVGYNSFSTDDIGGGAGLGIKLGWATVSSAGRSASGILCDYYFEGVLRLGGWGVGVELGGLDQQLSDFGEEANWGGLYAGAKVLRAKGPLSLYAGAAYVDGMLEERHLADLGALRLQAGVLTVLEASDLIDLVPRLELQYFHGLGDADYSALGALLSVSANF